jgi:hypothetical protein
MPLTALLTRAPGTTPPTALAPTLAPNPAERRHGTA